MDELCMPVLYVSQNSNTLLIILAQHSLSMIHKLSPKMHVPYVVNWTITLTAMWRIARKTIRGKNYQRLKITFREKCTCEWRCNGFELCSRRISCFHAFLCFLGPILAIFTLRVSELMHCSCNYIVRTLICTLAWKTIGLRNVLKQAWDRCYILSRVEL